MAVLNDLMREAKAGGVQFPELPEPKDGVMI
jgi:hypothetical protein